MKRKLEVGKGESEESWDEWGSYEKKRAGRQEGRWWLKREGEGNGREGCNLR